MKFKLTAPEVIEVDETFKIDPAVKAGNLIFKALPREKVDQIEAEAVLPKKKEPIPDGLVEMCRKLYKDFLSYGYESEIGDQIVMIGKWLENNDTRND